MSNLNVDERVALVKEVGEEILTEEELRALFEEKKHPVAYDGFEPSGNLHIAQGIMRSINVNKMLHAGVTFKMWVADWFGWMNNKMGGDLERIRTVGKYQVEVWKACGMDTEKVKFLWANDVMGDQEYWKKVVNIARANSVQRIVRCAQIMGRSESMSLSAAQIFYPCMQCADVFHLGADITQLGMDQRKVNVLAREVGPKLGFWKPVVVSHHMLMGLGKPPESSVSGAERGIELKMSKSKPDTAIFMTDAAEEIKRKIMKAYCPEKQVVENPLLEYAKYLIFERCNEFTIARPEKFGGDISFASFSELAGAYEQGRVHPADLKLGVAEYIDKMVAPVREHFEKKPAARKLFEQVRSFEVTR